MIPAFFATGCQAVIKIPVANIHPNYFQTRLILPEPIAAPFYSGQIGNQAAADQILELAREDSDFAYIVSELLLLGESIETGGQIEPITGYFREREF